MTINRFIYGHNVAYLWLLDKLMSLSNNLNSSTLSCVIACCALEHGLIIMNRKRRCIFGMRYLKDSDFIVRVRDIQNKLSTPLFSAIVPSPTIVGPKLDQLAAWVSEAFMKDYRNVALRRALRAELNDLVSAQCTAVNAIAQDDVNVMVQSGFELIRLPIVTPIPEPTKIKSVLSLNLGIVKMRLKKVLYCRFYELQIKGPDGFVRTETSPITKVEIPNLPLGVRLRVIARTVNSKGRSEWSLPLGFVVNIEP